MNYYPWVVVIIFFLSVFLIANDHLFRNDIKLSFSYKTIFLGYCICCCCCAAWTGDFEAYEYSFSMFGKTDKAFIEPYYLFLASLSPNFSVWRLLIWLPSFLILLLIFWRTKVNMVTACYLFVILLTNWFFSLRVSFAYSVFFLALSLIHSTHTNSTSIQKKIAGGGLLLSSFYIHKSMPLFVCIYLLCLYPIQRKHYKLALLVFPFLYYSFNLISTWIINNKILSYILVSEVANERADSYMMASSSGPGFTIFGWFSEIILHLPPLILATLVICDYLKEHRGKIVNTYTEIVFRILFILFYLSLLFYNQPISGHLSARFRYTLCWPLVLYLSIKITEKGFIPKKYKYCIIVTLFSVYYCALHYLYKHPFFL